MLKAKKMKNLSNEINIYNTSLFFLIKLTLNGNKFQLIINYYNLDIIKLAV